MKMKIGEKRKKRREKSFSFESPALFCYSNIFKSCSRSAVPTMATKMKGIYKGIKYISQIFVVKERELEIGYPTDVKHVGHIGLDEQSDNAPSWMKEFKNSTERSATSVNDLEASKKSNGATLPIWSARDFDNPKGGQQASGILKNSSLTDRPKPAKKQKRKKIKSATCSPTSSRASRAKSKGSFAKSLSHLETSQSLQGA